MRRTDSTCSHNNADEVQVQSVFSSAGSGREEEGVALAALSVSVNAYGRGCCIQVTKETGFQRYAAGDRSHGEAETGLVCSHLQLTPAVSFENDDCFKTIVDHNDGNKHRSRAPSLFVTKDSDCPHIMLLHPQTADDIIWFEIGYNVLNIRNLRAALHALDLTPEALCLLFAIGGSDYTPGTQRVPQVRFLESVLQYNSSVSGTNKIRLSAESSAADFDVVVVLAYLHKTETKHRLLRSVHNPRTAGWRLDARVFVAGLAKKADDVILEPEDVELQARRCLCLLRYWQTARETVCTTGTVGGCDESSGFDALGNLILERQQDVNFRLAEIRATSKLACGCKLSCGGACGCKRKGSLCLSICGCKGQCDRGLASLKTTQQPAAAGNVVVSIAATSNTELELEHSAALEGIEAGNDRSSLSSVLDDGDEDFRDNGDGVLILSDDTDSE